MYSFLIIAACTLAPSRIFDRSTFRKEQSLCTGTGNGFTVDDSDIAELPTLCDQKNEPWWQKKRNFKQKKEFIKRNLRSRPTNLVLSAFHSFWEYVLTLIFFWLLAVVWRPVCKKKKKKKEKILKIFLKK